MKYAVIALFILAGCAHDEYNVIPNSNASQANMANNLHDCKMQSVHKYYSDRNGALVLAGGALGGLAGGAVVGAIDYSSAESDHKDINSYTEVCMREKGYEGKSY